MSRGASSSQWRGSFPCTRRHFWVGGVALPALLGTSEISAAEPGIFEVANLKVDLLDRPRGLQNREPRFSWQLVSPARDTAQAAYRILVASNRDRLILGTADLWDSGVIRSEQSFGVIYAVT